MGQACIMAAVWIMHACEMIDGEWMTGDKLTGDRLTCGCRWMDADVWRLTCGRVPAGSVPAGTAGTAGNANGECPCPSGNALRGSGAQGTGAGARLYCMHRIESIVLDRICINKG